MTPLITGALLTLGGYALGVTLRHIFSRDPVIPLPTIINTEPPTIAELASSPWPGGLTPIPDGRPLGD